MSEGLNVLFIEDDPPVRQATAQSLELAGFNVQAFGSAEEAVGKIDANFPGVVVSDLRLPGASGLDVLTHCQSFAFPWCLSPAMATSRWPCRPCAKARSTSSRSRFPPNA